MYVLTGSRTFSRAGDSTYKLEHLKRATIIGEVAARTGATETLAEDAQLV